MAAASTAIVVGLVAITPAAGFVSPTSALLLGREPPCPATSRSSSARQASLDDSLDVWGVHGVGGTVGALLTGVFAQKSTQRRARRRLAGNPGQVGIQALAVIVAIVYSGAVSFVLLKLIGLVIPLRATLEDEATGLDITMHGEEAYLQTGGMESIPGYGVEPVRRALAEVPAPVSSPLGLSEWCGAAGAAPPGPGSRISPARPGSFFRVRRPAPVQATRPAGPGADAILGVRDPRGRPVGGARPHRAERYRSGRNGGASKASCRVTGTWVRIPPSPPLSYLRLGRAASLVPSVVS